MSALPLAIFFLLVLTGSGLAQAPQSQVTAPGAGAITGVVVDWVSGAPVQGATVLIEGGPLREDYHVRQITDARGRFAFLRLANTGTYRISVSKFGYLDGGHGRDAGPSDPLRSISIRDGAWISDLRVPIFKPAEISGVVRDETGQPVVGVLVRAYARVFIAGHEHLATAGFDVTDDRGDYRVGQLAPGRYIVQVPSVQMSVPASMSVNSDQEATVDAYEQARLIVGRYPLPPPDTSGARMSYPPAYHPHTIAVTEAETITVGYGDNRSGVDVTLVPMRAVRVSGRVIGPPASLGNLTLRLLHVGAENLGNGAETATAAVAGDGSFLFLNVPSGEYTLDAPTHLPELIMDSSVRGMVNLAMPTALPRATLQQSWSPNVPLAGARTGAVSFRGDDVAPWIGRMRVTVGASDVTGLSMTLTRLSTVTGRVVVEAEGLTAKERLNAPSTAYLDRADGRSATHGLLTTPEGRALALSLAAPIGHGEVRVPGGFSVFGVQPGAYWIRISRSAASTTNWVIKSVTWRGRDHTTTPIIVTPGDDVSDLVVTVTSAGPAIAGIVHNPTGVPAGPTAVVVFPVERTARVNTGMWPSTLASTVVGESGSYWIAGLPAGDYFIAAIPQAGLRDWRSPAALAELERVATRVSLRWGQTENVELTKVVR